MPTSVLRLVAAALIEAAVMVGLVPVRAKYSRASFLFPEQQVTVVQSGLAYSMDLRTVLILK
jgi:hypothetical protein